jgi:L-ribulose-5-phosphate 4-epimerase
MNAPAIKITKPVREQVSKEEWEARVNLAACYRLMAEYGMIEMVANHISVRVPGSHNEFLINPYGMLYEEMTASSMLRIDLEGNVVAGKAKRHSEVYIHSEIFKVRPDVHCVLHTHPTYSTAFSATGRPIRAYSQGGAMFKNDEL